MRRLIVALLLVAASALAQVPPYVTYQGRVIVNGTNFTGTGYFKFALISADETTTYWSNDGSSAGGSEPLGSVALAVSRGLFSVRLGDTNVPAMQPLGAGAFDHPSARLRAWFDDGVSGSQVLSPDETLAAAPYAFISEHVRDGGIGTNALDAAVQDLFVNAGGDAMSGPLTVTGEDQPGLYVVEFFSGTNRIGWGRRK
jgi:hypothetical protein